MGIWKKKMMFLSWTILTVVLMGLGSGVIGGSLGSDIRTNIFQLLAIFMAGFGASEASRMQSILRGLEQARRRLEEKAAVSRAKRHVRGTEDQARKD
jgi:hypothetical protein